MTGIQERLRSHGPTAGLALVLIILAFLYPQYLGTLEELPLIGNFIPGLSSMVIMIIVTMMAVGLNIVVGYAGLLDLGYVAFYAVGAYTAAWFASQQFDQWTFHFGSVGISKELPGIHLSIWLVLLDRRTLHDARRDPDRPADAAPARRLPRDRDARLRRDRPAGRAQRRQRLRLRPHPRHLRDQPDRLRRASAPSASRSACRSSYQQSFQREQWFYWTTLALLLFTVFCSVRLRDSRLGRAWIAIREDETAAAAMGVPLMRTKTWSYAIGAFFGGVAGAFYASFRSGAFPADFYFNFSVFLLCMVILGGMGSIWGVIFGGMILGYLNVAGLATLGSELQEAGIDFDPTKYQFGFYGVIIVRDDAVQTRGVDPRTPAQAGAGARGPRHALLRRDARGLGHRPQPER